MKNIIYRTLTFTLLSHLIILTASAQNIIIKGRVQDAKSGEPIVGATVVSAANGTATDFDGNFQLKVGKIPADVTVSFIGYETQTLSAADPRTPIVVHLAEEQSVLDDIVVVGYGTQSRTQLTGSVVKVKADIFENSSSATLDGALSGQVAGLNVTAASGQPGASSTIRIRGGNSVNASNEPLYVIDGFIYFKDADNSGTGLGAIESSLNPLATINPNDIESVEVLKDVSATAIYGSRGANGVILVTTKKGKEGDKNAQIRYGFTAGVARVTKTLDLLNASEWAQLQKTYFGNKGGYTDEQIAALGSGTDWQDEVLRTAAYQSHELSINGAGQKSRYAFSGNYTNQDGIILNSGFQRYNFHTNVEWTLRPDLRFGINATFGRSKQNGLTTSEEQVYNSSPFSAGITNSFVYALLMPPVVSVRNADGSYNFNNPYEYAYFAIGDHAANPVYDLEESVAENIDNYLLSNIWTSYTLGDFVIKIAVGYNADHLVQNYFSGAYTSLGLATNGIGGVGNRQTDIWQQEYTLTWNRDLNDANHLDAMVGYTKQSSTSTYSNTRTSNFSNETLKQNNLGGGSNVYTPQTAKSESDLNSFIARVNYTLLSKYNATATFRADNSSRFAHSHRWGYFPSLGISWNVDREPFLQGVSSLSYLKIRLSGGVVGNQEIPDYAFSTAYDTNSYGGSSSYSKKSAANENLKWETTASYNVGADFGFLDSRLNVVFDAYYKKTSDLLLEVPMGFASGVTTQWQNVGNVENKGLELSVSANIIKSRNLTWTASLNVAHNRNAITHMGSTNDVIIGSSNQQILRRGEALGSFYGLRFLGIVQNTDDLDALPTVNGQRPKPGDVKYEDLDGNGRIDASDRQILGSVQPKLTYGFSTNLQVRWFDIALSLAGSVGNKLYNALGSRLEQTGDSYNVLTTVLDSWTPDNASNTLPKVDTSRPFSYIDSRYVQNANYLKLRNLTIGYRLPLPDTLPLGIRITASGSNLFTISPYKGYDPEVASGTDSGAYPASRSFLFGINLTL